MNENTKEYIIEEFVEALIDFSGNKISKEEAYEIANERLNISYFENDTVSQKGPRWFARMVAISLKLI